MVEPHQVVTKEQSQTLAENLVLASVSLIARAHGLFGREAFARSRFVGTEVDVLRPHDGNDEAAQVLRWLNSEVKPRLESDALGAVELEVRVGHTGSGLDTEQFHEAFVIQVARRDRQAIRAEVAVAGAVTFLRTLSTFLSTLDRPHDGSTLSVVLRVSSVEAHSDQGPGTSVEGNDGSERHRWAELTPAVTTAHESQQRPDRNEDGVRTRDRGPWSRAADQPWRHIEDVQAASTNTGSHQLVLRARLCRDHGLNSSSSGPSGPSESSRAPAGASQVRSGQSAVDIGTRIQAVGSVASKRSHRPETAFDDRMEPVAVVTYKRRRL